MDLFLDFPAKPYSLKPRRRFWRRSDFASISSIPPSGLKKLLILHEPPGIKLKNHPTSKTYKIDYSVSLI